MKTTATAISEAQKTPNSVDSADTDSASATKVMAGSIGGTAPHVNRTPYTLLIKSKTARYIAPLGEFPQENEVLWYGGDTFFKVIGKAKRLSRNGYRTIFFLKK